MIIYNHTQYCPIASMCCPAERFWMKYERENWGTNKHVYMRTDAWGVRGEIFFSMLISGERTTKSRLGHTFNRSGYDADFVPPKFLEPYFKARAPVSWNTVCSLNRFSVYIATFSGPWHVPLVGYGTSAQCFNDTLFTGIFAGQLKFSK